MVFRLPTNHVVVADNKEVPLLRAQEKYQERFESEKEDDDYDSQLDELKKYAQRLESQLREAMNGEKSLAQELTSAKSENQQLRSVIAASLILLLSLFDCRSYRKWSSKEIL